MRKAAALDATDSVSRFYLAAVYAALKKNRELLDIVHDAVRAVPFTFTHVEIAALSAAIDGADIIDPEDLARVRRKALSGFQSELAAKKASLTKTSAKSRLQIESEMSRVLKDDAFEYVRGDTALAKLPEAERREWQKLWEDVEQLRKQATLNGGFVQAWLVLSKLLPYEGKDGVKALDSEQFPGVAGLSPRAGNRFDVGDKTLEWKEHHSPEAKIDFAAACGSISSQNRVAFGVCYVHADADRSDLTLWVGSDDQAKVYLNGNVIHRQTASRALELDRDEIRPVALLKGMNVLVFKVVNQGGPGPFGSLRFLTKDGDVPKGIEYRLSP